MHIAIGYNERNKTRTKFYNRAKAKGYNLLTTLALSAQIIQNQ